MEDYIKQQISELDRRIQELKELLSDPEMAELASAEITDLETQKQELTDSANQSMSGDDYESDSLDSDINPNVAIMEIRSAAGGDEAGRTELDGDDVGALVLPEPAVDAR